jgi:single-strand DNA-binding protein
MYNKIILIGNLTKDLELKYTPQGTPMTSFRIAVNSPFKAEEALFIDVVTFGKLAENCSQYLGKGKAVLVEGRLQEKRWESEGKPKSKFQVVAQIVQFISKKADTESRGISDVEGLPEETIGIEPF